MGLTSVLKRLKWLKYFYPGQTELQDEQGFWNTKRQRHLAYDHVSGISYGLEVTETAPASLLVDVAAGRAVDPSGDDDQVSAQTVNLTSFVPGAGTQTVYIVVYYSLAETSPYVVPELGTSQNTYSQETPVVQAQTAAPAGDVIELARVEVAAAAGSITDASDPLSPGNNEIDQTHRSYLRSILGILAPLTGSPQHDLPIVADLRQVPSVWKFGIPQLPTNCIGGLITKNEAGDLDDDVEVAAGKCRDDADSENMILSSALIKRIDAAWAVGTNQGGVDTGAVAGETLYAIWLIKRTDTGVVDALFSLSFTVPTMPTDYDKKRLIAAVWVDDSVRILAYKQSSDYFRYMGYPDLDIDDTVANDVWEAGTLKVPPSCMAHIYASLGNPTTTDDYGELHIRTKGADDRVNESTKAFLRIEDVGDFDYLAKEGSVLVDENQQIEYASSFDTGTATVVITTIGFHMFTRRDP